MSFIVTLFYLLLLLLPLGYCAVLCGSPVDCVWAESFENTTPGEEHNGTANQPASHFPPLSTPAQKLTGGGGEENKTEQNRVQTKGAAKGNCLSFTGSSSKVKESICEKDDSLDGHKAVIYYSPNTLSRHTRTYFCKGKKSPPGIEWAIIFH